MKRLFAIRNKETRKLVPDAWFGTKALAKTKRNELGKETHAVTYGPDHRRHKNGRTD